jgi:hypothetical protein
MASLRSDAIPTLHGKKMFISWILDQKCCIQSLTSLPQAEIQEDARGSRQERRDRGPAMQRR